MNEATECKLGESLAVITGGGGSIGHAIAEELIDDGVPCALVDVGNGYQAALAYAETNPLVRAYTCDVTSLDDCIALHEAISADHERTPLILVDCAGITRDSFFHKMTPEDEHAVLRVNLVGTLNMMHAFYPGMRKAKWGRIINISSINGQIGQMGQVNYAASKAGIIGAGMSLARECARLGVTVNTISPGYVRTPMTAKIAPEILKEIEDNIPVGRMAEPEHIAYWVKVLVQDRARHMTGENISVNGGARMSA